MSFPVSPTVSPSPRPRRLWRTTSIACLLGALLATALPGAAKPERRAARFPDVLFVTVDTLRADRLSAYGYRRPTSPVIDALLARGVRFTDARTVEPLTAPAMATSFTGRYPHQHGATRNGLRMRPGLASLPKVLQRRGYRTAAFVGNWTLRDKFTGLAEHFERYDEVFSRKRWLGLFNSEATGEDLTDAVVEWVAEHHEAERPRPYFAWVHYVEPHAPYRFHEEMAGRLGIRGNASASDRYDTEVAFVDREIGRLLSALDRRVGGLDNTLVVFAADHGESLGEHGYWGHGRHLYEEGLKVPLGVVWPRRIPAGRTIDAAALLVDLPATVLGLVGLPRPTDVQGTDWSAALTGRATPAPRVLFFEAHKGAVQTKHESSDARRAGLLEVARIQGTTKEVFDLRNRRRHLFDLARDPAERHDLADGEPPSPDLAAWLAAVEAGLVAASDLPVPALDDESLERLRALGYLD